MNIVIVIVVVAFLLTYLFLLWTKKAWKAYCLVLCLANISIIAFELYSYGRISAWWPAIYLYYNLSLFFGCFIGHVAWDYFINRKNKNSKDS